MDDYLSIEQQRFKDAIREFVRKEIEPLAGEIDQSGQISDELLDKMQKLNLPGMMLPEVYGGSNASLLDCVLAIETISGTGCGSWWYVGFANSIPDCLLQFGTDVQKARYLPDVVSGKSIPSIQFTEEETGSDIEMLQTICRYDSGEFNITGMKRFSTFGARPGFAMLYAKNENGGCTAFVLEKFLKGYTTGKEYELMGSGGVEAVDVYLDNLRLSEEHVVGEKEDGFPVLQYWISVEKIQQAAACLGIAKAAFDEAVKYAKTRLVRKKTQARLQGIRFMIADMYAKVQAMRCLVYRTASLKDCGAKNWQLEAAATKLFIAPAAMEVVETARRIHGAYGYVKDAKIERLYRAVAGATAIAVSLEINKSIVAGHLV